MMKRISILTGILCLPMLLWAQTPTIGDLEGWQLSQSTLYYQPTGGFWATLNALADLGGPVTVERVTDACQGDYAAKLTTKNFTSLLVSGFLASGTFNQNNLANPLTIGSPFTLKPVSFSGCYKYTPVSGDSAALISILTRWNTQTNKRDTLASAGGITAIPQTDYVNFNYTYEYFSQETPDSIEVVFSASADGANNNGQVGSTLWVDNVNLSIVNGLTLPIMPEGIVSCYPNPATEQVFFNLENIKGPADLKVFSTDGKQLLQTSVKSGSNTIQLAGLPNGTLLYTINQNDKAIYWGTVVHN